MYVNIGSAVVDKSDERESLIHNSIEKGTINSSASLGDDEKLWGRLEKKASRSKMSGRICTTDVFLWLYEFVSTLAEMCLLFRMVLHVHMDSVK